MERKIWCTLLEGILKAVHFNVTQTNIKIYQIPTPIDFLKQSLELKNSDLIGVETNQEQEAWLGLWALISILYNQISRIIKGQTLMIFLTKHVCVQRAGRVCVTFIVQTFPTSSLFGRSALESCWGLIVCSVDVFHTGHPLYTTRRLFVLLARSMWLPAHCPSPRTFDHIDGKTWPKKWKRQRQTQWNLKWQWLPAQWSPPKTVS